jgi:cytochrome c peroxidase
VLGDPLVEQAQGPFLNPLEQAIPTAQVLCQKVKKASYAGLFEEVWGKGSLDCAKNVNNVYVKIAQSVAAYEESPEVNPYTSKFDRFWDAATSARRDVREIKCGTGGMGGGMMAMGCPGGGTDPNRWTTFRGYGLTDAELQGLAVFNDPNKANCASCHSLQPGPDGYPLFTDYGYDNIGIPKNPENPFYTMPDAWNPDGAKWVDYGLGGYLKSAGKLPEVYEPEMGKFKVPTLRNVDLRPAADTVKAYGHNGYFKSLDDIVLFYHWRAMMDNGCMGGGMMGGGMGCDNMASMFPAPEVDLNRATLGMFPRPQVANIVEFLKTLSDGYKAP